jgi:hypothetical protein
MTQSDNSIAVASSTSQLPNQSSLQQADQAISEFERSNLLSFWPALNKTQIIAEMRSRIHDPFQVNQGGQPFCRPAAVTFALSTRRPLRYVEVLSRAIDLALALMSTLGAKKCA